MRRGDSYASSTEVTTEAAPSTATASFASSPAAVGAPLKSHHSRTVSDFACDASGALVLLPPEPQPDHLPVETTMAKSAAPSAVAAKVIVTTGAVAAVAASGSAFSSAVATPSASAVTMAVAAATATAAAAAGAKAQDDSDDDFET